MAIVTFMSDFGEEDHYVAAVKGKLLQADTPPSHIIDISHRIRPHDIGHAAYVLSHAYPNFPKGTIHLVGIDPSDRSQCRTLIAELDGHLFVGGDTGLFSLLKQDQQPLVFHCESTYNTFPAQNTYTPIVGQLLAGVKPAKLGKQISDYLQLYARQPKVTKREIVGNVIRVDHFGNLITNIQKSEFDTITNLNGDKGFEVQVGLQVFNRFNQAYDDVDSGECYIIFNSEEKLQIGINKGNGSKLLGLRLDSPVYIHFQQ
jgi:S-adenosylmethionine hydrolase